MGAKTAELRKHCRRRIRGTPLSPAERTRLLSAVAYEGSPLHKRSPGDFGLTPPVAPRPDKTLCDEANVITLRQAHDLLRRAVESGLASEDVTRDGFPRHLWVVDTQQQVFEAAYGGSRPGCYHGYPVRRSDPMFDEVLRAWKELA